MKKTLILCDFDGTITESDVTDTLLNHFATKEWEEVGKAYLKGTISHAEMNTKFAQLLNASPMQVNALLKKIPLRPGFSKLLSEINYANVSFVVISSGWDYYIERILQKYNPRFLSRISLEDNKDNTVLQIIANKISFDPINKMWNLQLLWDKNSCRFSSPCKGHIVKTLRKHFNQIIVIGNSESDICMAENATIIFAFGTLQQICKNKGIPTENVSNFYQVKEYLSSIHVID